MPGLARCVYALAVVSVASFLSACSSSNPETASAATATNGTTRTYYIAAEDTVWDYAPSGSNQMEGRPFQDVETRFMEPGPTVIGRKAKKALYFE